MVLEDERRCPRKGRRVAATFVVALILAALRVGWIQLPAIRNSSFMQHRAANDAIEALKDGDLDGVEKRLEANRGEPDFAYFFASQTTPQILGDALGSVAGEKEGELKKTVDAHKYELTLTDLAGTLALATYGTGDRALPAAWAGGFATATTAPNTSKTATEERAAQDQADKQNLLLLLARGYWPVDFLQTVTKAYWTYDHDKGDEAWLGTKANDGQYAPAPNGTYLTDGILALTAALTANPAASAWAFTDFQPGTQSVEYDGDDHALGNFSHFLLFEHQFPKSSRDKGESLGMTATLTALSSAIDAEGGPTAVQNAADTATADLVQPMADSRILQGLAKGYNESSDCSWNPLDYGHCVAAAAKWVWDKIEHWGHSALNILSLTTFAPPPFNAIGLTAAATNATWYAVEGDWTDAGLSLAVAVPGLAFTKIAKVGAKAAGATGVSVKVGADVEKEASEAVTVAKTAVRNSSGALAATQRELAEAGAVAVRKGTALFPSEAEAEADLVRQIPGSVLRTRFDAPGCVVKCQTGRRIHDVWDPKTKTAFEVKRGFDLTNKKHALAEIRKDIALLDDPASDVTAIMWHFFPDMTGKVGPVTEVRELLQQYGIPYVMHVA